MTEEYKKDFLINVFYIVTVLALIVVVMKYLLAYIFPFVIGVIIAYTVQKPAYFLSHKLNIKKQYFAVLLTVLICAVVLAAVLFGAWAIGNKLTEYISKMPQHITGIQNALNSFEKSISKSFNRLSPQGKKTMEETLYKTLNSFVTSAADFVSDTAAGIIKSLPGLLISSIVTVVAGCYLAKDFDRLKRFAAGLMKPSKVKVLNRIKLVSIDNSVKFIKGYGIISVITFLELSIAFYILGLNKPIITALVISLVDALPVLGVGTVIIPWAIIELLKNEFYIGFGLIITYAAVVIIRNFIEPKIIGNQMGINPVFTLFSMFLGLKIAGVIGMILFPLTLTVVIDYYKNDEIIST